MRILHVNDVASVGSILVRAASGRDALYQPTLRRDLGPAGAVSLLFHRLEDSRRLRRRFHQGHFSHLHVHYATFAILADLGGLPYSLHVHGGDVLLDLDHPVKRWLTFRALRRARAVVVSTPDLIEPVRRLGPRPTYVPNPMEIPAKAERARGGPLRMIVLSKMDRLKGWPEQVRLVAALKKELPGLAFTFFGHGQLPDHERHAMRLALERLGGVLTPPVPRETLLASLGGYDFALGQLEVGSLGMSELEALAHGLPVIANAAGHHTVGLPAPVVSAADAPARLREWAADRSTLKAVAEAGREYVGNYHDPGRSLRALEGVLIGRGP